MFYYGFLVVGAVATLLVLFNLIVILCCSDNCHDSSASLAPPRTNTDQTKVNFLSSFKFKKEFTAAEEEGDRRSECAICLSAFEDEEYLKKLPRCRHVFHAPCIDMWLYSHSDCPLCRAPVTPPPNQHHNLVESGHLV